AESLNLLANQGQKGTLNLERLELKYLVQTKKTEDDINTFYEIHQDDRERKVQGLKGLSNLRYKLDFYEAYSANLVK
ncbi:12472_t:CDS:2, partial [Funneliformis caledonium]